MDRRTWVFLTIVAVFIGAKAYAQQPQRPPAIQLFVTDMHCKHCAKKIASKLYTVRGVASVTTNVASGQALITPASGQQVSPKKLWESVESIKFTPTKLVTPQAVFHQKPAT